MQQYIEQFTNCQIIPSLSDFIRIPNLSPQFDNEWMENKYLDQACDHIINWIQSQLNTIQNVNIQKLKIENSPDCIVTKIPGKKENSKTILCYGHYDKQPHFTGWKDKFGPTTPIISNGRLYGRGSADDGCVPYAVVSAIKALEQFKISYNECYLLVEGEEESGSKNLIEYIKLLKIENIDVMIAIDSGIVDYDRLWITNSMRGAITFDIEITKTQEPFRYLRILLDQLENSKTGDANLFKTDIPNDSLEECIVTAPLVPFEFPMTCEKMEQDHTQQYIQRAWRPAISYIGGLESLTEKSEDISIRISMRIPPNKCADEACNQLQKLLNTEYSKVTILQAKTGLAIKPFNEQFKNLLNDASLTYFNNEMRMFHEGASIPFLNSLYNLYPNSQFLILGVLAPDSNAHGPNENLDINYLNKLIGCIAHILQGFK